MLQETGRIIDIETNALWVETIRHSTCNACAAKKGCGQRLLSKITGQSMQLRVLVNPEDMSRYKIGNNVVLGIPGGVVVKGSLFVYLLPLLLMMVFSGLAHSFTLNEAVSILSGLGGLLLGGLCIYGHAHYFKNDSTLQPIVLEQGTLSVLNPIV